MIDPAWTVTMLREEMTRLKQIHRCNLRAVRHSEKNGATADWVAMMLAEVRVVRRWMRPIRRALRTSGTSLLPR